VEVLEDSTGFCLETQIKLEPKGLVDARKRWVCVGVVEHVQDKIGGCDILKTHVVFPGLQSSKIRVTLELEGIWRACIRS
jgi:hypothetical protein